MKAGVLSPTGTCHTFDISADGYGRADGLGALYLKKLSKAIADGDPIRSIIRGSAVNRFVYFSLKAANIPVMCSCSVWAPTDESAL